MALSEFLNWDVATTGNNQNGGAFNVQAAGSDYSQQDSPQKSGSDLAIHASDNTKIRPVAAGVASTDIGNVVNITAGTGFTAGRYEITAQDGTYWTVDRATGTVGSSGGTYRMGGRLSAPATAIAAMVQQNIVWLKNGTYQTVVSIVLNNSQWIYQTASHLSPSALIGYNATHDDNCIDDNRPLIQAITNTGFTVLDGSGASGGLISNIRLDGSSLASTKGLHVADFWKIQNVKATNFGSCGIHLASTHSICTDCEVSGTVSSSLPGFTVGAASCSLQRCYSHNNAGVGFGYPDTSFVGIDYEHCIAANNGGRGFDITYGTRIRDSIAYKNGTDGVSNDFYYIGHMIQNSIFYGNGGYGIKMSRSGSYNAQPSIAVDVNAFGSNTSGALSFLWPGRNVDLSADPFVDGDNGDFRLNSTAGGGTLLKGAGIPGRSYPWLGLFANQDIGSFQHADPAAGATLKPFATTVGVVRRRR